MRIKILDCTLFITQVELKPHFLCHANALGMKRKAYYPITNTHIKILLRVLGPSHSLPTMRSSDQFQKRFLYHWLGTLRSLVLQIQIHPTFITMI